MMQSNALYPTASPTRMMLFIVTIQFLFSASYSFVLECKPLPSETLDGFHEFLATSFGYADVCPFVIRGESACHTSRDNGYVVPSGENLYLTCDPYRRGSKCVIDCPLQRHFTVSTGSSLTLESMVLSGAEASAVYIEPQGQLTVFDSRFEYNNAGSNSGGAIYASTGTILQVRFSDFQHNRAGVGGAILGLGETSIFQSTFHNNIAEAAGGAIASDDASAKLKIDASTFELNEAASGGAVFVEDNSQCSISYTTFDSNVALSGGAIETFGTIDLVDSTFMDNFANAGGAINVGPGTNTNMRRNDFMNNRAESNGPAVYDRFRSSIFERDNTACGNSLTDTTQQCDGVLTRISLRRVRCRTFTKECVAPTQQPSTAPSNSPSVSPSLLPSHFPSISPTFQMSAPSLAPSTSEPSHNPPTELLSEMPSFVPSHSPSESQAPSTTSAPSFSMQPSTSPFPSSQPSDGPSFAPSFSLEPSTEPTETVSASPSLSLEPSESLVPTSSMIPSNQPSDVPSHLHSHSIVPSDAPSLLPSESNAPSVALSHLESDTPNESIQP